MKIVSIIILVFFVKDSYCQNLTALTLDSSNRNKLHPCRFSDSNRVVVDTISYSDFYSLLLDLNKKIKTSETFSVYEEKAMIKILNTLQMPTDDHNQSLIKLFPTLMSIKSFFDSSYIIALKRKYDFCIGNGFAPYFYELKLQYGGNPFICSRYFVKINI